MKFEILYNLLKTEPAYRQKQVGHLLFKDLIEDWSEATILPKSLREKLNQECPIEIKNEMVKSLDKKSVKALIILEDGLKIETVLMRHKDGRNTACLSTQVGCPMQCGFCATGLMGFSRNLTKEELIEQALFWARYLKTKTNSRLTNVVYMGMGEPFLNYQNVISSIKTINDKDGLEIGARHISISTCGLTDGIRKLMKENIQVNLAISLHAPNNKLREKLMPVSKKYPLPRLMEAVDEYIEKTKRRVMFEYILIKNVNDAPAQARELAELMQRPLCFVNLIAYNETGKFEPSDQERILEFKKILERAGVSVVERFRFGGEIDAACGQLAAKSHPDQPVHKAWRGKK
jgi:23S rRNA (adenine2503-C2)-methyltransferase